MEYDKLLEIAKAKIEELPIGTNFLVKQLFNGTDWNSLPKGDKLGFGRYFKKSINLLENVEYCGKAENNSAMYEKTK